MTHSVSIIVCTKDREASLRRCLASILAGERLPDEIVVVDDGRLDPAGLQAQVSGRPVALQYLRKEQPGVAASRNLAVERAGGDVLLFLDDDVVLEPGYLQALLAVYEADAAGRIGGVTGVLGFHYRPGVLAFLRLFGMDGRRPGRILPSGFGVLPRQGEVTAEQAVEWLPGCNMSYRREVFAAGLRFDTGYPGNGWGGEDRDFSYRVGRSTAGGGSRQPWGLVATPAARLVHLKDPAGRVGSRSFGFRETHSFYRFFLRNMPKRPSSYLALAWALAGIVLKNLLLAPGRPQMLAQVRGNLQGLWAIVRGRGVER